MAALRKVQTLHLRSVQQSLLQRGAILIEDGLRTASIPGADGSRLLIVRRLSLGTIESTWSPMSVSLLIESRFRQLSASAVHAEDPQAENAAAVFFRDEVEPYLALALRIALGKETTAWFWKQAVSNWRPEMPRRGALRRLLYSILFTAPGAHSVLHLVQTLLRAHALEALLSALEPEDGTLLLQAFGWAPSDFSNRELHAVSHPLLFRSSPEIEILVNNCNTWGETDDRSLWLASILLVMVTPAMHHSPHLAQHALSLILRARVASVRNTGSTPRFREKTFSGQPIESAEIPLGQSSTFEPAQVSMEAILEKIISIGNSAHEVTCRAGLFFLLPVMERTGLPKWLEENRETHGPSFAMQILRHFVRRLKTPASDPVWDLLEEIKECAPADLIQLWVSRLRSYCRRLARIGLQTVICRAGRISVTPTHLDVQFPASDADIRIRRTGLDIDPGWLPWFGRVVHFHYLSRGDFDA